MAFSVQRFLEIAAYALAAYFAVSLMMHAYVAYQLHKVHAMVKCMHADHRLPGSPGSPMPVAQEFEATWATDAGMQQSAEQAAEHEALLDTGYAAY